jgi:phage protein D
MFKPAYKLTIGSNKIDSTNTNIIVSISINIDMDIPADSFSVVLANVNGLKISKGDTFVAELGYEDKLTKVIESTIYTIEPDITYTEIIGLNYSSKLLELRVNQTYENQSAGAIAADLANQAKISIAEKDDGIQFPFYVIDIHKNAYEHIHDVAKKCGFDTYS